MALTIRGVKKLLGKIGELTRHDLQAPNKAPNEAPEDTGEYEEFERYIADLKLQKLEKLLLPLIFLFLENEKSDSEDESSIAQRRFYMLPSTDLNDREKYRELYAEIYKKITPALLNILINWFRSIAFPTKQEQTGQTDNPKSILEKIIDIINSSNPDKRRELVLELLEAIGFSSDQSINQRSCPFKQRT